MIVCSNCSSAVEPSASSCPYCRAPLGTGGLARAAGMHDALVRDDTDALLARTDDLLARELGEQLEEPLTLAELRPMLVREEAQLPSLDRLETLLTRDVDAQLDGITLSSLLDRGSSDTKILQRGLVFLRKQRYTEALEWWSLHREGLDATQERLSLLLLLMEAFTHQLAGNEARAKKVREQIRALPIVQRLRR